MMYDQREKAQRDYRWALEGARREGREEGRQEGLEKGRKEGLLIGKIQLLQQLLKEEVCSSDDLAGRSVEDLAAMVSDLQERLRSRGF